MRRFVLALAALFAATVAPVHAQVLSGASSCVPLSGVMSCSQILAPDSTAGAPPYSFANASTTGLYHPTGVSGTMGVAVAGNQRYIFNTGAFLLGSGQTLGWSPAATPTAGAADVLLVRDAANTLGLRNGANAQTFNVYNTYTDASNYERGVFDWISTANTLTIGTSNAGTGAARNINFVTGGGVRLTMGATTATFGTNVAVAASGIYTFNGRTNLSAPGVGQLTIADTAGTNSATLTVGASNSLSTNGPLKMLVTTVTSLPSAATVGVGARAFVTDALTPVWGSAVVGGGSVPVPVYSTGSAWNVG